MLGGSASRASAARFSAPIVQRCRRSSAGAQLSAIHGGAARRPRRARSCAARSHPRMSCWSAAALAMALSRRLSGTLSPSRWKTRREGSGASHPDHSRDCISARLCGPRSFSAASRTACEQSATPCVSEAIRCNQMGSEAIRGHQRSSEVIRGHPRPSEAIRGHPRPSEAIRGHQRSSEAIRGHQRPSEAIRGNQRSSEAIRGNQR